MLIYGAMAIPLIIGIVLYGWFKHKMAWWEFFVPVLVSILLIGGTKVAVEFGQVQSTEYWGSLVNEARYYEAWDEWIQKTCSEQICSGSGEKRRCRTRYYDCSYVDYHSAYWVAKTTTNQTLYINKLKYQELVKRWGNQTFKDMHRDYHNNDGDMYFTKWDNDEKKAEPVTTKHSYENRVKVAEQSVFNFKPVDEKIKKQYKLKDYPEIYGYNQRVILGDNSQDAQIAEKKISFMNGLLGPMKQVKVFINVLVDQPILAAEYQEHYWKGGNKNEFIVHIGIDKNRKVNWCKVTSWTREEALKAEVKQFVIGQDTLNLQELGVYLQSNLAKKFKRREFKEFSYLKVEPPTWSIVMTYILTLLVNIGLSWWIIVNEIE